MYKLDVEKAEKLRSNCQHLLDQRESKGILENIYFYFIDYVKAFDCVDHNQLWKILKEMGTPDHLTCLRNLYASQETTVRKTDMEQQIGSKLGEESRLYTITLLV